MKKGDNNSETFDLRRKYAKKLLFLIGTLVIINFISLFVYAIQKNMIDLNFNYDFKFKLPTPKSETETPGFVEGKTCEDGTALNECSEKKPLFCYNGQLLEKAHTCGCPEGLKINFQSCEK